MTTPQSPTDDENVSVGPEDAPTTAEASPSESPDKKVRPRVDSNYALTIDDFKIPSGLVQGASVGGSGGFIAGQSQTEQYRGSGGHVVSQSDIREEDLPDGGIAERFPVSLEDVNPALADSAAVAHLVQPDREILAKVGEPLLRMKDVTVQFGGLTALDSVTFDILRGEILGLIGPNGAGKTTAFNAMTGVYRPTSGEVVFDGKSTAGAKRNTLTRRGIARTFQNIRLFSDMTALENVVVGTDARHKTSVFGAVFRSARHRAEERDAIERGMALLEFVGIGDRATYKARNLPYGYQRRLEIARALATQPKLLCLDEPAAGFNPAEKLELMELIRKIRDAGYTVLLIEHDMRLVMGVTDRIVVLEFGRKIADALPSEIASDPAVVAAYLGVPDDEIA